MIRYLLILPLLLLGCVPVPTAPQAQPRATLTPATARLPFAKAPATAPTTRKALALAPAGAARLVRPGLIGVINMADGGAPMGRADSFKSQKNVVGWWGGLVGDLDLRDPASYPQFRANCTAFVRQSYDHAERLGCEGIVFWDVEGGEHPEGTYIGDPLRLPPELDRATVAAWTAEAQRRGLRIGFCFRDTNCVQGPYGVYQAQGDPEQILTAKLQACRFAYGNSISLAYIDTFCEPSTWSDGKVHYRPKAILEHIQAVIPGWDLFLEFGSPLYDDIPRVRGLRWQRQSDDANGKAGDLLPKVCKNEILEPFGGKPTGQQLAQYRKAIQAEGAWSFVCVTWDRPDNLWVPQLMRPN